MNVGAFADNGGQRARVRTRIPPQCTSLQENVLPIMPQHVSMCSTNVLCSYATCLRTLLTHAETITLLSEHAISWIYFKTERVVIRQGWTMLQRHFLNMFHGVKAKQNIGSVPASGPQTKGASTPLSSEMVSSCGNWRRETQGTNLVKLHLHDSWCKLSCWEITMGNEASSERC